MRADCAPLTRKYLWGRKAPHRSAERHREKGKEETNLGIHLPRENYSYTKRTTTGSYA